MQSRLPSTAMLGANSTAPVAGYRRAITPAAVIAGVALLIAGCVRVMSSHPAVPSTALASTQDTALGRQLASLVAAHPGTSGFRLINEGREGFAMRTELADVAEHSIDAQYFLWDTDAVGTILLHHLMRAANRGVRVRLLVDDLYIKGRDVGIAALDAHPNVEIRLYNVFGGRNRLSLGRQLDFLLEFRRLNHRMHNKLFVVDNQVAVMGGRNIGDAYFGVDPKLNYRDMDVLTVGPVVRQLSAGFDAYWNSRAVTAIGALRGPPSSKQVKQAYEWLETRSARLRAGFAYARETSTARTLERIGAITETLIWAPCEVVWADPEAGPSQSTSGRTAVAMKLEALIDTVRVEIVTASPYVVADVDMPLVRRVRARGVATRVLTNSLASTDVPPAYALFATDRRRMLQEGVDLYEVRPDAASRAVYTADPAGHHRLALHAKLAVLDRQTVYIGSFNLDPRSRAINTEVALLIDSAPLAHQMLALLARDFEPENSFRVVLEDDGKQVAWLTQESSELVRYHRPPGTGFWRRFAAGIVGALPIRGQL
jgi:putative cardiolipin synthase